MHLMAFPAFVARVAVAAALTILSATALAQTAGAPVGVGWKVVTNTHLYTVHDVHFFLADEFVRRGAMPGGLTWHFVRPPVVGLDLEMDARGVARQIVL